MYKQEIYIDNEEKEKNDVEKYKKQSTKIKQ